MKIEEVIELLKNHGNFCQPNYISQTPEERWIVDKRIYDKLLATLQSHAEKMAVVERLLKIAKNEGIERMGYHCSQEEDGTLSYTKDYSTYHSICDYIDQAFALLQEKPEDINEQE